MDTGLRVRSAQPVNVVPVRIDPKPERQTVAAELPETQAVKAVVEDASVRAQDDQRNRAVAAGLNSVIDGKAPRLPAEPLRQVVQDQDTKELVFRKVSAETGKIIGQFPDEAMLRLKAYNAQVRNAELDKAAQTSTAKTA